MTKQGAGTIMTSTELIPVNGTSVASGKLSDRLFIVAYATICAVATLGWLVALGWVAIQFTDWLLF
jgi:hypothetical protein